MGENRQDAGEVQRFVIDYGALESIDPLLGEGRRHTVDVLVWTLLAGRQIEAWLSEILAARQLDISGYFALSALWLAGPPHRMTAGELARRIVQTSGGATKTTQRLVSRGLVRRVADPDDGRRSLLELTPDGLFLARETLDRALDAFDTEIGALDEAEREGVAAAVQRLVVELSERLSR
ncbi:MAG: MarR family transcriptional regulator [Acidimicrobiaceae bacterium]|nr:MarR family transcriptional regulator [Acidimicrobiaceae bacterium]